MNRAAGGRADRPAPRRRSRWLGAALVVGVVASSVATRRHKGHAAAVEVVPAPAEPEPQPAAEGARRRIPRVAVAALVIVVTIAAVDLGAVALWSGRHQASAATAVHRGTLPKLAQVATAAAGVVEPGPPPVSIDIPAIDVHSELVDLRLAADGTLNTPTDFGRAGWWSQGVAPGDPGTAIVVGHVDSYKGAAVFYRLRELNPGDDVAVERNDGSVVHFKIEAVEQFEKSAFPSDLVYGQSPTPSLRLITCGGRFDKRHKRYLDNIVVFAHLAEGNIVA